VLIAEPLLKWMALPSSLLALNGSRNLVASRLTMILRIAAQVLRFSTLLRERVSARLMKRVPGCQATEVAEPQVRWG